MLREERLETTKSPTIIAKAKDYAQLLKPNLSFLVVFSSVIGYLISPQGRFYLPDLLALFAAGILVTGSANTINQILERHSDALMKRTQVRPLPDGRMHFSEAWAVALVSGICGLAIITYQFNWMAGILSLVSLLLYAFAYTPLKKVHPIAVAVGAIPGALPPLIGWVAATGSIGWGGVSLFLIQFFWQFPHFWAIGFLGFDEYEKAGIRLLPSKAGKTRFTGLQCVVYSLVLFPLALVPRVVGLTGNWGMLVAMLAAVYLVNASVIFYLRNDAASAKKTMFASLIYLPLVQLALLFDKI
ncbi:MAG: protoheme IX farnesyltransferase [Sphingobacteriales bacterium]|nr:MAG: protoheme IX farnesyltransferase [Sphingobacteriales bacterium]